MTKIEKLTTNQRVQRYYKLSEDINTEVKRYNDSMYLLFNELSYFTRSLPDHLNTMSGLSDMITDALVITGKSSLSVGGSEMKTITSKNITFDKDSGLVRLSDKGVYEVPYKNSKSYITTENTYNIFNSAGNSLSSFNDLLNGSSVNIISNNTYYKYTFGIEFSGFLEINSLNLKLSLDTKSYPLLSELFYIDRENKRRYITILNNYKTSINLDEFRVPNNDYTLLFDNITVNKLYFTLEDRLNTELSLDKVSIKKMEFAEEGELILGPVKSKHHILKASLEAQGDLEGAEFYISNDVRNWTRIILPTEVNKSELATKIISFNTVSKDSIKIAGEARELYMRILLNRQKLSSTGKNVTYKSGKYYSRTLTHSGETDPIAQYTVYRDVPSTFYGERTYSLKLNTSDAMDATNNYVYSSGTYKVKGFASHVHSYTTSDVIDNAEIYSTYKKVNGDLILASDFNPLTSTTYGFVVSKVKRTFNTLNDSNIVLQLNDNYAKGIYIVRQNNKEIKIDLSLGFITNTLSVTIGVEPNGVVYLYNSTGELIKELTVNSFDDFNYVSLIENNLIDLPILTDKEKLTFNHLYPIKLNSESEYGLLDGSITSVKTLIPFEEYSMLVLEKLETNLNLSKENKNSMTLFDQYLKNKYTVSTSEVIKAYPASRAIKLKNKHIKKGTLRISQLWVDMIF